MHSLLSVAVLLLAGFSATDAVRSRLGGAAVQATNAPHACLILVRKPELNEINAYLGGGSIVSRNRVLTAAHLVTGAIDDGIQLAYYQGTARHRVNAFSYVNANGFDEETRENDISILIFRQALVFPVANVIAINVNPSHAASGQGLTLASYGFTTPESTGPTQFPMQGLQTNVVTCIDTLNATASHFCALDVSATPAIVCFGDNGSGLFAPPPAVQPPATPVPNFLVGVVSQILPGCAAAQQTSYTLLHLFENFFISMGIETDST